jgi:hypothetical protein
MKIMNRDRLYLIKPNFLDRGNKTFFCPGCAQLVGLLDYYPVLKQNLEVHLVDFQRPRPVLVELLGTENQSCPVLVLKEKPEALPSNDEVRQANGYFFIEGANEIAMLCRNQMISGASRVG